MEHYLVEAQQYRSTYPEPDVTLEMLRQVLFGFFGVPEPIRERSGRDDKLLDQQLATAGAARLTQEEADAWFAAGMPSPFAGWLQEYRHGRRR